MKGIKSETPTMKDIKLMEGAGDLLMKFKLVNYGFTELEKSVRDNLRQAS